MSETNLINIKEYFKQEVDDILSYYENIEIIAEDFNIFPEHIDETLEEVNVAEEVGRRLAENEFIARTIRQWIDDEIRDVLKERLDLY